MSKRAAIYTRVSTDEQAEKGYSLPTQLESCRKYASDKGFQIVAEIQDDYSGAKLDRPGLTRLRAMLDRREAEAVICYSVDRLTRNPGHAWELSQIWHGEGVELHFCNRGQTEDTPEGTMTFGFESLFAYYYRAKTLEATQRGKVAKAKAGRWVGNGRAPYGYRKIGQKEDCYLEIYEPEAVIVRRIFDLYTGKESGQPGTLHSISVLLTQEGIPSPAQGKKGFGKTGRGWYAGSLKRFIIDRRAYIGEFAYAGNIAYLPELAIIDRETFEAAQKQREHNKERSRHNRKKHDYLLSGYLRCTCGGTMRGFTAHHTANKAEQQYYKCNRREKFSYLIECKEPSFRVEKPDLLVWSWISSLLRDDDKLDKNLRGFAARREEEIRPKRERLARYEKGIKDDRRQIDRLARDLSELRSEGGRAAIRAEIDNLSQHIEVLTKERDKLRAEIEQREIAETEIESVKRMARAIRARLASEPTCEQKQGLFDLFDLQVQLRHDEAGRWLDCTCGLAVDSLPLDDNELPPCPIAVGSVSIFASRAMSNEPWPSFASRTKLPSNKDRRRRIVRWSGSREAILRRHRDHSTP